MPTVLPSIAGSQDMGSEKQQVRYTGALMMVSMLFFMWGFIACMNDILIPKLQEVFTLKNWQAMLIQTAFFGAYFVVSCFYFLFSTVKGDPVNKIGYKSGIIVGLVIAAFGCCLFVPAVEFESYPFFLLALFILASGTAILQIAANPYVAILGPPGSSSSRMNLTQALNSLGTTIAPIVGGYLIFDQVSEGAVNAESVKLPYLALATTLLLIALAIKIAKLPQFKNQDISADTGSSVLKHTHLLLGAICVFMYVGGEVSVGSTIINYLKLPQIAGMAEAESKHFLAFYWGGAMVGRFFAAVGLSVFKNRLTKFFLMVAIVGASAASVFIIYGFHEASIIGGLITLNLVVLYLARFIPSRTVGYFAAVVIVLLLVGMFHYGAVAMWAIIAIGLFNSVMFPTIFDLAIKGLGNHTSQGSSLLVMAIVGGAIIPPLQGLFADVTGSLQLSFAVPALCYMYILYYGLYGYKVRTSHVR